MGRHTTGMGRELDASDAVCGRMERGVRRVRRVCIHTHTGDLVADAVIAAMS